MRPAHEGHGPALPVYLADVATVEAEQSDGQLYDGSPHAETARPVAVALIFTGGQALLIAEDAGGRITRLRIPGPGFLHLTGDAPGKLARSRQPGSGPAGTQARDSLPARTRPGTPAGDPRGTSGQLGRPA